MRNLLRACRALTVLALLAVAAPFIVPTPAALAAGEPVVINEFLAINDATLADNTGAFEDWIELYNSSASSVDLEGWTLADGSTSFIFPAGASIAAGEYLVLFASGDVTRTTPTETHLPFKLSGAGESLTLSDEIGALTTPAWAAPASFPAQLVDDSYGIGDGGALAYFTDPTPGAANGAGLGGIVENVTFSVDHGFYTAAQTIVLDTPTSGSTIRYTTNGDVPTSTVGTAIAPGQSITVSSTATVRAVAYRDGWIPSATETRSYFFTADIVQQSGTPAGFPSSEVNGQKFDYGMDPDVVSGNQTAVEAALTAIPTISIVTDVDNLFDPNTGIYVNAGNRGQAWERPASVELIDPTGAEAGFDIEAGLRMRGGFSRSDRNTKHSWRLFFRSDYEGPLNYPLFGSEGDNRFEKVDLRTSQNYAWHWRRSNQATFTDELWSRDTQGAMGQPYTRSRQYHVYLNGTYWGIYMTQERVSGEFGESYFGGDEDDYDVLKRSAPGTTTEATDGDDLAWKALFPIVSDLQVTPAEFTQLENEVDLEALADYYLLHFFSGDFDGSPSWFLGGPWVQSNNWYAMRNRNGVGDGAKWQFFDHDSEHSLCANGGPGQGVNIDNTPPWNLNAGLGDSYMTPAYIHEALLTDPTYRQLFIDRVQLHMVDPGGALTAAENLARLEDRVAEIDAAVVAESARWGDGEQSAATAPYGRAEWLAAVQVKRDCFTTRPAIVEAQLRADGLWPPDNPPVVSLAQGKPATQSTTAFNGVASRAVDGSSDPVYNNGSVTHTQLSTTEPWWEVDLGAIEPIEDIQLWNRTDCCGDRLTNFHVFVSDVPFTSTTVAGTQAQPGVSDFAFAGTAGISELFDVQRSGRYVRVQLEGVGTLSLAEVAVNEDLTPPLPPGLILNEWNAVDKAESIVGGDTYFGTVVGNGGDWFELVVVEDNLDVRGWQLELTDSDAGFPEVTDTFVFADDPLLADLRSGTIITVSEDVADDVSFLPVGGDFWINLQSESDDAGSYFTPDSQSNFDTNNQDWQLRILDDTGALRFGPAGEGAGGVTGVGKTEVGELEVDPNDGVTATSGYDDGDSSTFGSPNVTAGVPQDFGPLRTWFVPDTTPASSAIATPLAGEALTATTVDITGSTTDDNGVSTVEVTVADTDNALFLQADGSFAATEHVFDAVLTAPGATATDWSVSVVLPLGNYELAVQAIDVASNVESSQVRAFSVVDGEAPTTPSGLSVDETTGSSVTLSWLPATDNVGVQRYNVVRDGNPVASIDHPSTSFVDTGLAAETSYSYTVTAEDVAGNESAPSASVTATTDAVIVSELADIAEFGTWQTNGKVFTVLTVGDTVYIGGSFTELRAPDGTVVLRKNLAALDRVTGEPTAFDPQLNGGVYALTTSPDAATLYVGGSFNKSGVENRRRVAAFDVATGLLSSFKPPFPNSSVRAIATDGSTLYIGGLFSKVGGVPRTRLAAYDLATTTLDTTWTPSADLLVRGLIVDQGKVWVAGNFQNINGTPAYGLAALDPANGLLLPTDHPGHPVPSIAIVGDQLFLTGSGQGDRGAAYDRVTGTEQWSAPANGNVQAVAAFGDYVYFGGPYTTMAGEPVAGLTRHLMTTGELDTSWQPAITGTGGARALKIDDAELLVGGDFTVVSGDAHRGFAVFKNRLVGETPPALISMTMFDVDENGYIDTVEAVFDEELAACAAPCTDGWTLTDAPSGATLGSVITSGSTATLQLIEGGGEIDTEGRNFEVSLAKPNLITDIDGNQASFGATAPIDAAAPIPVAIRKTNAGTSGLAESGDTFTIKWSERMSASSVPATSDVVIADPGDGSGDLLQAPGLIVGGLDMGSGTFIGSGTASFLGSTMALTSGSLLTTVTLATCSGDCAELAAGPSSVITYVADPALTDRSGNPATGSFSKNFKLF